MRQSVKAAIASAALLVVASGGLRAQLIHNTGEAGAINASFEDANWQYSLDLGITWLQAFQVQSPPSPPWEPNTPAYSWISATIDGSGAIPPVYLFRTFFDLTGFDPSTLSLSFNCAIDNLPTFGPAYFSLNGGAYGGSCGDQDHNDYKFIETQTIAGGFVAGVNELRFAVSGDATTDGMVLGNAKFGPAIATPEPASVALIATGFAGVFGVVRRRRATAK